MLQGWNQPVHEEHIALVLQALDFVLPDVRQILYSFGYPLDCFV